MSLLPQTIPSPQTPVGQVMKDGQLVQGSVVLLETNWWLFFYNLALQVLGGSAGGGLTSAAVTELAGIDSDVADADAIVLRRRVENLEVAASEWIDPGPQIAALRQQVANALIASFLPDPPDAPATAQPVQSITPGASPYSYTALFDGHVAVTAGTVSAIALVRQGTSVATGLTVGLIPVSRGDIVTVTYTGTPTMTFIPK